MPALLARLLIALVLSNTALASAESTSASLTITVTVLPTREQGLAAARISLRQPDGTVVVLDSQQRAQYIRDPATAARHVRPGPGDRPVLLISY